MRELDRDAARRDEQARLRPRHPPAHGRATASDVFVYDFDDEPRARRGATRPRLLARHRDDRGLLGGADGPHRDPSRSSTSTTSAGRSAPASPTIRRRSSSSATRRTRASASRPTRWSATAASSPAAASIAACSRVGCRINSFSEVEESRALRERPHRPPREDPALHHRQGRRDPLGHRGWLQPRGRPAALLRHRERPRRHPEARQSRRRARDLRTHQGLASAASAASAPASFGRHSTTPHLLSTPHTRGEMHGRNAESHASPMPAPSDRQNRVATPPSNFTFVQRARSSHDVGCANGPAPPSAMRLVGQGSPIFARGLHFPRGAAPLFTRI